MSRRLMALMVFGCVSAAMLAVVSGAALALTRDCEPLRGCFGSNRSDTMRGSRGTDFMFGLAGNDTMKGNGRWDDMEGGKGTDKVYGMRGDDGTLWGGHGGGLFPDPTLNYSDAGSDHVYGGDGADIILGGMAQGGVDRIFGGEGDDSIRAEQRSLVSDGYKMVVTKEIIDCGAGNDTVSYDRGVDVVRNCEVRNPG